MTKHALALVSDLLPFLDSRGRSGLVHAACPSLGRAFELRFSQGVRLSPKERREAVSRYAFTNTCAPATFGSHRESQVTRICLLTLVLMPGAESGQQRRGEMYGYASYLGDAHSDSLLLADFPLHCVALLQVPCSPCFNGGGE